LRHALSPTGAGRGALVPLKTSAIVMESEELRISLDRITVRYVFRNLTAKPLDSLVAFPMPELDGGDIYNTPIDLPSKDPLNFMGFHDSVDGRPLDPQLEIRVFDSDGKDITSKLIGGCGALLPPGGRRLCSVQRFH
jgi:hypothetical protein